MIDGEIWLFYHGVDTSQVSDPKQSSRGILGQRQQLNTIVSCLYRLLPETESGIGYAQRTVVAVRSVNDAPDRDPVNFELCGSNGTIDGPYTLIATGDIVDFARADPWPRFTKNETEIAFANDMVYAHYQVLFPTIRNPGGANSMQISEVELLGTVAP